MKTTDIKTRAARIIQNLLSNTELRHACFDELHARDIKVLDTRRALVGTSPAAESIAPPAAPKKRNYNYPFLTKGQIMLRLANDEAYQHECLMIIYNRQTAGEKAMRTTYSSNRMGFMSSHATVASKLAEKAASELTPEDKIRIRSIICQYSRQLAEHFRAEAQLAQQGIDPNAR